jgi:hypothetical protein
MADIDFQYINKPAKTEEKKEESILVDFNRKIDQYSRKLPYRSRKLEFKLPIHWGQRKLLLSEIEFLTKYGELSNTVLYVGAADGKHIAYLSSLFPKHKFFLYDPSPFDPCLKDVENIKLFSQLFTDEDIKSYESGILFISDIRNMPENYVKKFSEEDEMNDDIESNVKEDMDLQKRWVETLKPSAAMLKFRLPYTSGITEYFTGDIYFQAWAPPTSTETRIILDLQNGIPKMREYDNTEYESILYRFNRCTRIQPFDLYPHCHQKIAKSYDLVAEYYILHQYLVNIKKKDESLIELLIQNMSDEISDNLGKTFAQKFEEKVKIHNNNLKTTGRFKKTGKR